MALTRQEKAFIGSISKKIDKYSIRTTTKEAFSKRHGQLANTKYNTDMTETVDVGIEFFLIFGTLLGSA